jgi:hypothetical protein
MNKIMRVADLIQKYFPAESILNRIPNYKFSNYYILHDKFIGLIATKNAQNYTQNYIHLDDHSKEDMLAMNIDLSMFVKYNEQEIAKYMKNTIESLYQYSHL